jgi:hypothetical protein
MGLSTKLRARGCIVYSPISEKRSPLIWLRTDAQCLALAVQIPPDGENVVAYQVQYS